METILQHMSGLSKHLARHSGFTEEDLKSYKVFTFCATAPFGDASDDTLTAMVRYINPQNDNDWGYDVYVLHDVRQPSLTFWSIELVFSTHHELFGKRKLTEHHG